MYCLKKVKNEEVKLNESRIDEIELIFTFGSLPTFWMNIKCKVLLKVSSDFSLLVFCKIIFISDLGAIELKNNLKYNG